MEKGTKKEGGMSKRKKLIIAIAVLTALAALSYVLTLYPDLFTKKDDSPKSMYSDKLVSYSFYKSDYDLDVTTVPEYMELDRAIHYKVGNVSTLLTDNDIDGSDASVKFFRTYFDTLRRGDWEEYNTYFTDEYYKSNDPYTIFAPQMIYGIEIELVSLTPKEDGTTVYDYNVDYMIFRNDGTFRNDMGSDASKKLYYELIEYPDGSVKIDLISYYKRS